jgi:carbohydrate-selective porin OprB
VSLHGGTPGFRRLDEGHSFTWGPGQSTETVLEWAYNWYVNDVLTLTPDLQYIITPGGTGHVDDAMLLGLLTYVTSSVLPPFSISNGLRW